MCAPRYGWRGAAGETEISLLDFYSRQIPVLLPLGREVKQPKREEPGL